MDNKCTNIVVTGPPRSRTSLTMQVLEELGFCSKGDNVIDVENSVDSVVGYHDTPNALFPKINISSENGVCFKMFPFQIKDENIYKRFISCDNLGWIMCLREPLGATSSIKQLLDELYKNGKAKKITLNKCIRQYIDCLEWTKKHLSNNERLLVIDYKEWNVNSEEVVDRIIKKFSIEPTTQQRKNALRAFNPGLGENPKPNVSQEDIKKNSLHEKAVEVYKEINHWGRFSN